MQINILASPTFANGCLLITIDGVGNVLVLTDFGLTVMFDGWTGFVYIPDDMVGMTEGICADNNDDQRNDLIRPDGTVLNMTINQDIVEFGNSWQVDDPEDRT